MTDDGIFAMSDVTRFEVIDETGRALVKYGVHVEVAVQNEGRTLKVFIKNRSEDES